MLPLVEAGVGHRQAQVTAELLGEDDVLAIEAPIGFEPAHRQGAQHVLAADEWRDDGPRELRAKQLERALVGCDRGELLVGGSLQTTS